MSKPEKRPLNLRMDAAVIRRVKLHAMVYDRTVSDVVEGLIRQHLNESRERKVKGGDA